MKDPYAHDFFVANRWLLKIAGLWRLENENNIIQFLYTVYVTIIFLYVNMYFMLTEFVSIFFVYGNQFDLIKNISCALTHFMGTVKVTLLVAGAIVSTFVLITVCFDASRYLYGNIWKYITGSSEKLYKLETKRPRLFENMKDPYAHDFFVANRWLLKIAGLWRPENENNIIQFLYTVYVTIIFLYVNMFFMLTEFVSIFYVYGNQFDLIKNISWALTHFMGTVKVVFVNFQGHQLRKIMDNLENSKLHYEHCPSKDFFPGKISKRYKRIGITHTVVFLWMAYLIIILSYLPPVIAALISVANNTEIMLQQKLPYDFWTPFKPDTTTSYFLAVGFQIIPMFSYTHSVVGMDTLFTNIMNCIAMNLEIIQGAFISISPRAAAKTEGPLLTPDKLHNSDALTIKLRTEMKKVTKHLQVVYKACDDLEDVHKYLTLAQTTATLFILCSCLYVVSTTPLENKQFWAESLYMVAAGFELVLYCWFGNEITIKADNMPIYIWQCDWLTADKDFKMSLILNMARTKRQLYLTAGKFVPLTLPTFVSIMKVSYSFFTFIKNTE